MVPTQIIKIGEQYDQVAYEFAKLIPFPQFKTIIDKTTLNFVQPNATILEVGCGHRTWIK